MVSIMPCTAKKAEAIRPNSFTDEKQDTDIVITTTELLRMIDNFGLDFAQLEPEACDMPFGFGSGGGVIFGVTGGVTEAVLRRLSPDHSKETMREISECGVRGDEGIKEFTVPYKGMDINVWHAAVAVLWAVASRYGPVTEPKLQERKVCIMLTILC